VWERNIQITEENGRRQDTKKRVRTKQKNEKEEKVKGVVERNKTIKH
jgi:hypothetical protein